MSFQMPAGSETLIQSDKKIETLEQQARELALSVETVRQQTLSQSNERIEALEQKARDLARYVETTRQKTLLQSNNKTEALEQNARDLADFVETLRNQTRLQSETDIEALRQKARDLALFVETVRNETRLQSETEIAALGQKARNLAVAVESIREETLLQSDSEIAALGQQARDLAVSVETAREETLLQSDSEIAALGQQARDLAASVENVREETLLQSDTEIKGLKKQARNLALSVEKSRIETLMQSDMVTRKLNEELEQRVQSLRQANQTLQALIQTTPLAIITLDQRSHVTMWNSAAEQMFGWKECEVLGQPLPIVPADQKEAFVQSIHYEFRPEKATAHALRLCHKTGSLVHVNLWTAPVTDAGDAIVGSLGLFVNVTENKRLEEQSRRAEEAVRQSEARKDAILRVSLDAIITMDHEGMILSFNPAAERIFGYAAKEAIGKSVAELLIPLALRPRHQEGLASFMKTGTGLILDKRVEMPGLRADGSEFPAELTITRIPVDGPPLFTGFLRDITERKCLEEQCRQSQKMEAVGQLAAGVAHDFNNLLTIIVGYSELLLCKLPVADPNRDPLGQIRKAAERAAGLTRQLLAFGRKQILAPVVLDLNSLMTEMDKILRRLIGEGIELKTVLQPALGPVKADPGQIEQIIMNLVINSRDAMPTGGLLTIQTGYTVLTEAQVRQHPETHRGPYTLLVVSDTGHGMDQATKTRIFEPFFTTKEVGKGTGLGLSTVFGIIKQSGGFIEVDSALGSGSTFRIYLPQIPEATLNQSGREESEHGLVKMPRGAETILLVEDEGGMRDLAQLVLEASGYKVLSTRNGGEAVQVCHEYADAIHLLFTDVVMPKMSGRQLTDLLVPSRPSMKVLYMSGYTDDTMVRHGIQHAETNFLPKPFTPVALAQKVREVLDGTNGHQGSAVAGGCPPAAVPV
jgi:two-component system, cell cycle sensor histidine kinase and response regulator CckA